MKISIISAHKGKLDTSLQSFIDEYLKQLRWDVNFVDVPTSDIKREGGDLISKIGKSDYVIALDPKGKLHTSEEIAADLQHQANMGKSNFCFIIGGPHGLSPEVLQKANLILSFGRITLPHRLVKVILVEQIYRAWSIINNRSYHK